MSTRMRTRLVSLALAIIALSWGADLCRAQVGPVPTIDYTKPYYTNSPILRKFVDSLPGLGPTNANNLGQYIPIATPDTITYANCDYYEIWAVEYTERMHSDLPAPGTKLRGYVQMNNGTHPDTHQNTVAPAPVHYLGPLIIAQRDRPVRIKFVNKLSTGTPGKLFIPVDTTYMGAGTGPLAPGNNGLYTENRAVIHLHGGNTPWISDGTPHQWITPSGETTSYKQGVGVYPVPDMLPLPVEGDGTQTLYYTNAQSARLMFYHDHAYGITRLNVYAGLAAGYLLQDPVEQGLVTAGVIPADQIPLIIQDKTFVPDAAKLATTDPLWDTTLWGGTGDLWFPHVYMVNQDPTAIDGANPLGRWDYGPWFWPVFPAADPLPALSGVPEAFMDTPVVNGTAYPFVAVEPKPYRLRILNACNDRYLNLQLYYVDPANPTEVKMVPAFPDTGLPALWPTDARVGGVPDPTLAGPDMIVIGSEGGLLPAPVVIPSTPINYEYNRRNIIVLSVSTHGLFLGPAERADVIVDFSAVPSGSKLILYNDAPAPVPAFDPRIDYYTGDPDQTDSGGAPTTLVGQGPNTRTIMQFWVQGAAGTPVNMAALRAQLPVAFAASQPPAIVPQRAYGAATDTFVNIFDNFLTFTPIGSTTPVTYPLQPKAIQELFDTHGRMNATLGVELPFTTAFIQTTLPFGYIDPPTEIFPNGQTQLWKITHNGVDTHAIHFHLFNVQVVNRVGWDGAVRPPDPEELGWKETVKMNPLEDIVVAMTATVPTVPFALPDSIRSPDVTSPPTSTMGFANIDPTTGTPIVPPLTNALINYGHEYVWHCHILGHEENDMMRPIVLQVPTAAPDAPTIGVATGDYGRATVNFTPPAAGQVVAFYTATSNPGNFSATGTHSPITVPGLANGTAYTFTVTATNSVGTSPPSAPSNAVTLAPGHPGAPTSVTAVPGNASANVSFLPPASNGGSAITSYTVTSHPGNLTGAGAASPVTVGSLVNGTPYTFSVTATNAAGTGPASVVSNIVTPTALPGPPIIGMATAGVGQATITFTPPLSSGGSAITSYTATANPGGRTATGAGSPLTITLLTPGTAYTITVTATNGSGTGPASAASNSVTIPTLLTTAPTPISPLGLQAATPNPPAFAWTALNTAATYDINVWNDRVYNNASPNPTWTPAAPFAVNAIIWYQVRGVNALGAGPWSAWASFTVPPIQISAAKPTGPTGTLPTTPNPPQFSWTSATNATSYNVQLWGIGTYNTAGLTWTPAAPLTAGQTIWWAVQGVNGGSTGAWSAWQSFTVTPISVGPITPIGPTGNQPTTPNPPQFSWNAAANATGYNIELWNIGTYTTAGTTWTPVGALPVGQVIWWCVTGTAGGSSGPTTPWQSFTITPIVVGATVPIGPTGAQPNAPNPPQFSWNAAANATGYTVELWNIGMYTNAGTTWTPAGALPVGQLIWWRVTGTAGGSNGSTSAWQSFTITPLVIGTPTPTAPIGTQGGGGPNPPQFTWTAAANATGYNIELWNIGTYQSAGTTWTPGTALARGTLLWWRVTGTNGAQAGSVSAWASFTIP